MDGSIKDLRKLYERATWLLVLGVSRTSLMVGGFRSNPSKVLLALLNEGRFNGGFFALPVWGAYIWRGLFSEFYGIIPLPTWPTLSLRIMVVVGLRGSSLKLRYILQAM